MFLALSIWSARCNVVNRHCVSTPDSPNFEDVWSTAGCSSTALPDDQTVEFDLRELYTWSNVNRHLNGLKWEISIFKDSLASAYNQWLDHQPSMPYFGIYEFNPRSSNTTALTNNHCSRCRILRELRWWMTALESGLQLAHTAHRLQGGVGFTLACRASRISTRVDGLMRLLNVSDHHMPPTALCRQTMPISTGSETDRITFTSVIMNDALSAITRIDDVMSTCTLGHRLRVNCHHSQSLFYEEIVSDLIWINFSQMAATAN